MTYLKYFNLSLPKFSADYNQWVDHIEFFCFLSQEGTISNQQIIDRVLDENSNNPQDAIEDLVPEDEIGDWAASITNEDEIIDDKIIDSSGDSPAFADKIPSVVNSYFDLIKAREANFSEDYPFILLTNNRIELKKDLTTNQTLYLVLLCSSLLRLATKGGLNKLGHHFEQLCEPVFRKLTPLNTQNFFFGSGGSASSTNNITGTLYKKVVELSELLHVSTSANFTLDNIGVHNSGDGGLDWVGIFEFGDNQMSQPIFFGQCACGNDWVDKEFDAHISKWKNYIQFSNGYLVYHFIPRHFRDQSLYWDNPLDIFDVVLIDRLRLISLLKSESNLPTLITKIYKPFLDEVSENKIDGFS